MPKYKMTVVLETQYDLEIEADSQAEAVDMFNQIEKDGQVEELAVDIYSYNPFEITYIEEIK